MKVLCYVLTLSIFGFSSLALAKGHHSLTDEQKSCVRSNLQDFDERPDPEQMQLIFEGCGVDKAPMRPPFLSGLSDEDRNCLASQIGNPLTRKTRPSKREMKNAFENCGLEMPRRPRRDKHSYNDQQSGDYLHRASSQGYGTNSTR